MLRPLLALLLCLFFAGLAVSGELAPPAMQHDQSCMQQDAHPADCSGDDMAANACALHCAVGACVVSAASVVQLPLPALAPSVREAVFTPDSRSAPDTAPPKAFAS